MSKFFDMTAAFLKGREGVKTLAEFRALVAKTLPGFSMTLSWPAEDNSPLGYVNGFVNPPGGHTSFKPVFVIGSDEADFTRKMLHSVPRLLKELSDSEAGLEESLEYVSPDRRKLAREAAKAAKDAAKEEANGPGVGPAQPAPVGRQPVRQRGPRKVVLGGQLEENKAA